MRAQAAIRSALGCGRLQELQTGCSRSGLAVERQPPPEPAIRCPPTCPAAVHRKLSHIGTLPMARWTRHLASSWFPAGVSFYGQRLASPDPKASVSSFRLSDRSTLEAVVHRSCREIRARRQQSFAAGNSRPKQGRGRRAASEGVELALPTNSVEKLDVHGEGHFRGGTSTLAEVPIVDPGSI